MFNRILSDSFNLVFRNLDTVFKVCGAWFFLLFVLTILIQVATGGFEGRIPGMYVADKTSSPATIISNLILVIVGVASSASIAVAWHRFGLLGETPGFLHLHLGALELRFFLKTLLLGLIVFAVVFPPMFIVAFLSALTKSSVAVPIILIVVGGIFLMPHFLRLNLILPATAIGHPIGLKEAHRLGKGLGWQMIGAYLTLSIPFVAAAAILQFTLMSLSGGLFVAIIIIKLAILSVLLQIIMTVIGISVITAGYRIAIERAASNSPEEPSNPM